MNSLNTHAFDTENNGFNNTLIFTNDDGIEHFTNPHPEILYNFNIDQIFLKKGYIEMEISYPNKTIDLDSFLRFFISFVMYDINEEELLLKDTPDVDYNNFRAQNIHTRIRTHVFLCIHIQSISEKMRFQNFISLFPFLFFSSPFLPSRVLVI
jgi:hypothetical protein